MKSSTRSTLKRRRFLQAAAAVGLLPAWTRLLPAYAQSALGSGAEMRVGGDRVGELVIARTPLVLGGRRGSAVTINGTVPGPLLRFKEGETVTLRVTNRLDEDTSIHWHGLLLPSDMDGVPGISFPGIRAGETFTYRYPVRQSGTYWYHSHSAFQEQQGHYAPMIIDPADRDPVAYDREHVVLLSDWTFGDPHQMFLNLKKQGGFFNFQQRTLGDFFRDARLYGWRPALEDRLMWADMRMEATDVLDVTGAALTYLVNGMPPETNWTALFKPGERVRLRFINAAAATFFNVRIPGLPMTVVQADGQDVQPVTVDEFQMGIAETYDVIVQPRDERAYTVFAESIDRSGYARGTLAPRAGMSAPVPPLRERPIRSMADMGMDMEHGDGEMQMQGAQPAKPMPGMDHGAMGHGSALPKPGADQGGHGAHGPHGAHGAQAMKPMPGMDHGAMGHGSSPPKAPPMPGMGHDAHGAQSMKPPPGIMKPGEMTPMHGMESPIVAQHGPDAHGPGNSSIAQAQRSRLGEPGIGLENAGHRVLTYLDLKRLQPGKDTRPPSREIELHLTGNMELFLWSVDGKKFSEAPEPFRVSTGERVRVTIVNDTMMEHPMHQHGVFMELVNGAGAHAPHKHTIIVKGGERLSYDFTYDEPGNFAFHCHVLFHMEAGMFRFFNVSGPALWRQA